MNIKQFNILAQTDPLSITDEMALHAQKKALNSNKVLNKLFLVELITLIAPAVFIAAAGLASVFSIMLNSEPAIGWSLSALAHALNMMAPVTVGAAVVLACTIWPIVRSCTRNDTTLALVQCLSTLRCNECAQVVALCNQSPSAKNFRDAVLAGGQELRKMHLLHMKKMAYKETAPQEDQARVQACREAHGLSEPILA